MRILLFSGKGGVGKTTLAAATAVRSAAAGRRVLILSTDAAHSLADSLESTLGPEPRRVAEGLDALEIDVNVELERGFAPIQSFLSKFLSGQGLDEAVAEEMAILPGMEELFSLLRVGEFARSGAYDVLVVDCAPTGETVRMLAAPDVLRFYFRKIFPAQRAIARTVRPVAPLLTSLPVPEDDVFSAMQRLYGKLEELDPLLRDPATTSVRIVLTPEKMVIAESERLLTYLGLFGYGVDAVVANRLLPDDAGAAWTEWLRVQRRHLTRVDESFAPIPILRSALAATEILGPRALDALGERTYGPGDPSALLHRGRPPKVEKRGDMSTLSFDLPFAESSRLSVFTSGEELTVTVDNWRRSIALPRTLAGRDVLGARLADGRLRVRFGTARGRARRA